MRFNIPLLPFQVKIQWRTLPRFRIVIWHWMLAVGIIGVHLSVLRYMDRLGVLNRYHGNRVSLDPAHTAWDIAETNRYFAAIQQADVWLGRGDLLILTLAGIFLLGRALNRFRRNADQRLSAQETTRSGTSDERSTAL